MTSIKKYIDGYEEELVRAMGLACREALAAASKNAERAVPGTGYQLSRNLARIQDQLLTDLQPATVLQAQHAVDAEFRQWADNVEEHLRSKAGDAKDIMLVMAKAAQSLGNRDQRYVQRFGDLMTRLKKIGDLADLSEVRRSIMASASELSADVLSMEAEGQRTIANLELKLEEYRKQLAAAERRGCLDALTGLMNRRGIELSMADRIENIVPFCVVLIDLDSFKAVNDKNGHVAGDDLLTQFARELQTHCRSIDLIGRWGGDEFIILITGDRGDTQNYVDRLTKWAFGAYKIKTARGTCAVELSGSIGVAIWDLKEAAAHVVARADESMYHNKRKKAPES